MTPPKKRRAVIFGTGSFAEVVDYYLSADSDYNVVAFTASEGGKTFRERPVIDFASVELSHPAASHDMFVAIGYRKLNVLRERFCIEARAKGYRLLTYVSSAATRIGGSSLGDNVFIFEDNTIQPFVTIGDGAILWSGNHIGHHTTIGPYAFVSSHVVISGGCRIGSHAFLGVNATIADNVSIGEKNLIGAGALIERDTGPDEAYFADRTPKFGRPASRFFR